MKMEAEEKTETQTSATSWLEVESESLNTNASFEKLPAMKFPEENKIEEIEVDFSKPFDKYTAVSSDGKNITKAIVPVKHDNQRKIWWINKKNPIYKQIIDAGKKGITKFKITRTGNLKNTRYNILKE